MVYTLTQNQESGRTFSNYIKRNKLSWAATHCIRYMFPSPCPCHPNLNPTSMKPLHATDEVQLPKADAIIKFVSQKRFYQTPPDCLPL